MEAPCNIGNREAQVKLSSRPEPDSDFDTIMISLGTNNLILSYLKWDCSVIRPSYFLYRSTYSNWKQAGDMQSPREQVVNAS